MVRVDRPEQNPEPVSSESKFRPTWPVARRKGPILTPAVGGVCSLSVVFLLTWVGPMEMPTLLYSSGYSRVCF